MAMAPNRLSEPGTMTPGLLAALCGLGVVLVLGGAAVIAFVVGSGPTADPTSINQTSERGFSWPVMLIGALLAVVLAGLAVLVLVKSRRDSRYDHKAKYMATVEDMEELSPAHLEKEGERMGTREVGLGVPLGRMVCPGGIELKSSFEYVRVAIMGPRAGKTSGVVVRELMETTGPAIVTSNKRDVVDTTRGPRSERGLVRVQDIQQIVREKPTWWWNPLSFVHDVETAERLTAILEASSTPKESKGSEPYFPVAGRQFLSSLLLAAALGDRPMSTVLAWVNKPDNREPLAILREHGFEGVQETLRGLIELTGKQRDGVTGTAAPWVGFLRNPNYLAWIEPTGPDDKRPQLNVDEFVASQADTLYLVSKEGAGSGRAITAALTMAILDAADRLGSRSKGGRLPRPLMACLDEAANVVRWPELPDLYSHYGSRGIILSVFLQSWTQGVEAWGEGGMKKMWSAANVQMVGKGVGEAAFLRELQELIGTRDVRSRSLSSGKGGRSSSWSIRKDNIFDISELRAIPKMRALVFSTGAPATYVKLEPWWMQDSYSSSVKASQDYYESVGVVA